MTFVNIKDSKFPTNNSQLITQTSSLKVCVLGTRGFPNIQGGIERHCERLYCQLARRVSKIIVFGRRPYTGREKYSYCGVEVVPLFCPRSKFLETFWHTFLGVWHARALRPDILHIHAVGPGLFVLLARILGLRVVFTHHGQDYKRKKWNILARIVLRLGEFIAVRFANCVVCISPLDVERLNKKRERVFFIPNGVEIKGGVGSYELGVGRDELGVGRDELGESILEKYGLEKRKYILAVGRFVPEKGFDVLISAYSKLQAIDYMLVIVGDADHKDKYSRQLKAMSKEAKNVILTGKLEPGSLDELYSQAGLFVLPSYYEGLPIVLLEALSRGLRCIASDIAQNRAVGILPPEAFFKAGDVQALAEKIKEFVDKPLTEEEKIEQIKILTKHYYWEKIAKKTLEVYKDAVEL